MFTPEFVFIFAIVVLLSGLFYCDAEESPTTYTPKPRSIRVEAPFYASTPNGRGRSIHEDIYKGVADRMRRDIERRASEVFGYDPQSASVWSTQDAESILDDIRRFKGEILSVTPAHVPEVLTHLRAAELYGVGSVLERMTRPTPQTVEESIAFPTREDWTRWEEEQENARELLGLTPEELNQ